nr:retrovirus-related Pol polyprotein from transposon TNT 1-94 [Tanacetum cinerariifolium]
MVIYNALPRKEYERIFMCNTAKEIWKTLLTSHQGNSQVKDNKIDLLAQQSEQFVIFEDESIDSAFARFNTIITSLKALDEGYSSKNYVRKFLRALHPKWKAKVTAIKESKDLSSLSLDELIGNLKVHEMIIKKDSEIVKAKVERKSLAFKAKKESINEECSTSGSEDEEYAMVIRDFKKFFKRRGRFVRQPWNEKRRSKEAMMTRMNQRAFVRGSWRDSDEEDDEKVNNETCLVAQASSEICLVVDLEPEEWIKDSRCSKHMTGNRKLFSTYKAYNGGNIIFGSNLRGNIIGKGQICDNQSRVIFSKHDSEITKDGKVIDTSTYILNQILIRAILGKTPYELLRGRKPTLDYFRVFGRKCFILNTKDYLTKFNPKSYEGIFLGYSQKNKAYIILNKHTRKVKESLNMTFDETLPPSKTSPCVYDDLDEEEAFKVTKKKNLENDIENKTLEIDKIVNIKESRNHLLENVIGNLNQRTLRSQAQNQSNFFCFISTIEPKNVNEALGDETWIVVFKNKLDENGIVSRNKARLVAQDYNQQEGINYDETYIPVARLESIRILLAYACALDFKLFQMKLKNAFLNGFVNDEVYVAQPPGFIDLKKLDHVYKLKKALYGLKQEPKAWSSNDLYSDEFTKIMHEDFEMSMMVKRIFLYVKGTSYLGLWYPKRTDIETVVYADSDHAGDYVDRKSTSGICMFVVCCLTSGFSKKQTALAISTTEAEYVSTRKACEMTLEEELRKRSPNMARQRTSEIDSDLEDLVLKFINQFFPPSKTTYLRNEITNFLQKPIETYNEAWERFKDLLRQCPHHGFLELHQLDTFYNVINPNDQDALDSAAGGIFLDKIPRECLSIIESKSKIVASLEDKLDIRMNRFEKSLNDMKNSFVTPTAPLKEVEE